MRKKNSSFSCFNASWQWYLADKLTSTDTKIVAVMKKQDRERYMGPTNPNQRKTDWQITIRKNAHNYLITVFVHVSIFQQLVVRIRNSRHSFLGCNRLQWDHIPVHLLKLYCCAERSTGFMGPERISKEVSGSRALIKHSWERKCFSLLQGWLRN